ncbi:beta strand repeat-containing protein, partial [Flavobacterium ajazii]|uniref:beta strand repeat-containing protein n=1 Tax=Flavobacterium ajazii TaxID=2692318 RepID=UPI0013CFDA95
MIQKLLLFSISLFSSLNQNKFSSIAKWFCLTFLMFQMGYGQTCNVVTNSTFTGNATGWTLGGSGTGWYYESTWAPNEIYIEKDGAVNQSLKQTLSGLISNSLTLTFKIKGQNANRLNSCPTTAQLDIKIGGVTYMTILNPVSNSQITTANVSTSNGATYTQTGFPLTVGGTTSATVISQGTITLTIPWNPATATTADLEFVANTSNTTSTSPSVCLAWGGDDWFLDDIMLYANNPTAYNMAGTSVCAGTSTIVGLANSQLGVNYQLYRNGSTAVGSAVAGTGSAISFGSQTVTGVYTAIGTAGTTSCTTPMNGSVSINPNPTLTGAAQPAAQPAVCAGSAATINLTGLLASTTSTINYTINGIAQTAITGVVSDASGAGSFTTPVLTIANNGQILQITSITNTSSTPNCSTSFTQNVTLAVRATPTLTGATQPTTACVGSGATINLTGLLPSVTSTISYTINGVAQTAVTGVVSDVSGAASFSTVALTAANNTQQLSITGVTTTSSTPNCSASFTQNVTLSVSSNPTISTAATTGVVTAACQSASVQTTTMAYTATTFSPTSYSIDWATLADQGSTAFSFAAGGGTLTGITIPAGTTSGTYTGTMTVTNASGCTGTKAITLTVNPVLTASVSIAASSATVCAGTTVTFTATPTNPGTTPVYQWKLNGVNVGTNSTTYTNSTLLLNNDVVTCEMTSNATPCLTGSPATSNAITVASSGPTTTGVTICTGGSGSLSSSTSCVSNPVILTKFPTSGTNGSGNTWTNPTNIYANDNVYATRSLNNTTSALINATGYDFSTIPNNATITNIEVIIGRFASNNNAIRDVALNLIVGGTAGGTSLANTTTSWTNSESAVSYSASPTSWGYGSLTLAQVKASNFGVAFSVRDVSGSNRTASIDYISLSISYTVPGSIDWYTASSGGTLLGSGATFNPVGVTGSGLANTNSVDTKIYYAECSTNPGCRTPTTFVINAAPTITSISSPSALCPGGSLNPSAPTVTANGSTVTASGWEISTTSGGSTYTALSLPYTVAYADNSKNIRYYATNGCGTTYSNVVALTVNNVPTVAAISSPSALCSGGSLNPSAPTVTNNGSTVMTSGWEISTTSGGSTYTVLSLPYTVAYADNGKNIRYYATNSCGTTYSNVVAITVNNVPTIAAISSPSALCSGGSLNPSAPTVTNNGSTVSASGWEISTTSGGSTYTALSLPYTVAYADNGKNIRYYATNGCGTTYSNVVAITVNNVPTVAVISSPSALCSGGSLNPSAPTVTNNGSTVSASGWEISTTSGGSTYTSLSLPYTVAYADNGKNIRYYATNGCGTTYSNVVAITVNNAPTVAAISSPSALCPGGSLNPSAPTVTANGS